MKSFLLPLTPATVVKANSFCAVSFVPPGTSYNSVRPKLKLHFELGKVVLSCVILVCQVLEGLAKKNKLKENIITK